MISKTVLSSYKVVIWIFTIDFLEILRLLFYSIPKYYMMVFKSLKVPFSATSISKEQSDYKN